MCAPSASQLDLSNNKIGGHDEYDGYDSDGVWGYETTKFVAYPEGVQAIAGALRVNGGLTSIDLSRNQLCGIWFDDDGYGYQHHGTYTAEGITAIADALGVNGALTQVLVFRSPWISLFCSLTLALL